MNNSSSTFEAAIEDYTLEDYNEAMRRAVLPVTVLVGIECVAGVVGNILVLIVFTFYYKPSNFRYFVLCLSVTDLLCSLTTIPFEIVSHTYWYTYPSLGLCKTKSFLNMFTVCSECLCLFVISIDRYRKICRPHGWQISERMALYLCYGLYAVSIMVSIPVPIFWGLHTETHYYGNVTINVTKCEKDQEYLYSNKPVYYTYVMYVLIGATVLAMFILYVLVARVLLKKKSRHRTFSEDMSRRKNAQRTDDTRPSIKRRISRFVSHDGDEFFHGIYIGPATAIQNVCDPTCIKEATAHVQNDDGQTGNNCENALESGTQTNTTETAVNFRSTVRQKTRITITLTIVFMVTIVVYFALLLLITENFLVKLSVTERAIYFFFFRLYFLNHVINPIIYGILDTQFKNKIKSCFVFIMRQCLCRLKKERCSAMNEQSDAKMVAVGVNNSE